MSGYADTGNTSTYTWRIISTKGGANGYQNIYTVEYNMDVNSGSFQSWGGGDPNTTYKIIHPVFSAAYNFYASNAGGQAPRIRWNTSATPPPPPNAGSNVTLYSTTAGLGAPMENQLVKATSVELSCIQLFVNGGGLLYAYVGIGLAKDKSVYYQWNPLYGDVFTASPGNCKGTSLYVSGNSAKPPWSCLNWSIRLYPRIDVSSQCNVPGKMNFEYIYGIYDNPPTGLTMNQITGDLLKKCVYKDTYYVYPNVNNTDRVEFSQMPSEIIMNQSYIFQNGMDWVIRFYINVGSLRTVVYQYYLIVNKSFDTKPIGSFKDVKNTTGCNLNNLPSPSHSFDFRNQSGKVVDELNANNKLLPVNGPTFTNNYVQFNGSGQYMKSSNMISIGNNGNFSVEFYVNYTPTGANNVRNLFELAGDINSTNRVTMFNYNQTYSEIRLPNGSVWKGNLPSSTLSYSTKGNSPNAEDFAPGTPLTNGIIPNTDTHYVLSISSSKVSLYQNGNLLFEKSGSNLTVSKLDRFVCIARGLNDSSLSCAMKMYYFRLFDSALSKDAVTSLYSMRNTANLYKNCMSQMNDSTSLPTYLGEGFTRDTCATMSRSRGFKYFGLQDPSDGRCFAGNDLTEAEQYGPAYSGPKGDKNVNFIYENVPKNPNCNISLTDNQTQCYQYNYPDILQGYSKDDLMAEWKTVGCNENRTYQCQTPPQNIGDYDYQGCFKDEDTKHAVPTYRQNVTDINQCQAIALKNKDMVFGLQNYGECWTGNNIEQAKQYGHLSDYCGLLGKPEGNQLYLRNKPFPPPEENLTNDNFERPQVSEEKNNMESFQNMNETGMNRYIITFICILILLVLFYLFVNK